MPKRRVSERKEDKTEPVPPKIAKEHSNAESYPPVRKYFKKPGVVLTFGQGDVGQLGLGPDTLERSRPAHVSQISKIVNICAGGMHTLCLTDDGKVISFGCNDEGALGRDGDEFEPKVIDLPDKAVQVTAGDSHSAALLVDGRVYAWGAFRDSHGSMGLNLDGLQKSPVLIPSERIIKIASGADHLVLLTATGHVFTSGCGEQGQLGRLSERAASRMSRQGLNQLLVPAPVTFRKRLKIYVDDIWAGSYCTYIKEKSGHVYVCGLNNYNQLGLDGVDQVRFFYPVKSESFSQKSWTLISGGQHHTLGLDSEGVAYTLGRKEYGRLGLGEDCLDKAEPTPIPALKGKKCVDVACGSCVSFAVTAEGEVYAWGMGTNGQLGTGDEDDVYVPTKILGKELKERKVFQVSAGGQHTVLLAV